MFTVYHSNQIDILKSLLVELVRQNPLENPFEKEQILVQSPGMSQWLKMELANEFGIAANLEFPLPATFIWELFTQILPDVPKRSAFNKEGMTWKLMHLLPSMLEHEHFEPLARYLNDDEDNSKLYQLVEKIADIFDGYLVDRKSG
ncbi:exodeoxyribonuclease V subunit gamma, partial [Vibrio genomosp. F10]|uniref:exodeoxyribonuclease V subunit gamma n=1 Tax=Vibrio genomosp. F10 TaxID=723171 RepID=UPI0018E9999D